MAKGVSFRRLVLILLLIVVLVYATSWFLTKDDATLTPQAQAWLEPPAEADLLPALNAHFHFLGFTAPRGTDPMELGRAISAANRDRMARGDFTAMYSSNLTDADRLLFVGEPKPFDAEFLGDYESVLAMARDNNELMRRYDALLDLTDYQPGPDSETLVPDYADALKCHALYEALFTIYVQGPDPASAVKNLARDTAFWRMAAAQSGMLLFKILGNDVVMGNNKLLLQVLNANPGILDDPEAMDAIMAMTAPATPEELDWTPIYEQRLRDLARLLASPPALSDMNEAGQDAFGSTLVYAMLRPLLARDTTLNRAQELLACRAQAASDPQDLDASFAACAQDLSDYSSWSLDSFSNPFGRRMLLVVKDDYSAQVRDFHARFNLLPRMIRAWALMLQADVPQDQAQEFLDNLGSDARDPFTGLAFQYDPTQQTITGADASVPVTWPQSRPESDNDQEQPLPDAAPGQAPEPMEAPAQ